MYHSPHQINPEAEPNITPPNPTINTSKSLPDNHQIDLLLGAIIQIKDLAATSAALRDVGVPVIHLSSSGGFLRQQNATLLLGIHRKQYQQVIDAIHSHCSERIEYIATPLEGTTLPLPLATPIPVGGATIFSLRVERFEEL